uniref:Putative nuclease HARBI1 n=1 Tax=Lygus hesperus TaxID=30085 RepID=A0A0A9XYF6_LYGHE
MQLNHMPKPTVERFQKNAQDYFRKWGYLRVLGSLDGKHIRIKCPPNPGSMFYNYKHFFSIVLMAVADANYKFVMIDVGAYGKDSDGGVFANTLFYKDLESGKTILPSESTLPNSTLKAPYVFLGDEAFPLRTYLMRPFPAKQVLGNSE